MGLARARLYTIDIPKKLGKYLEWQNAFLKKRWLISKIKYSTHKLEKNTKADLYFTVLDVDCRNFFLLNLPHSRSGQIWKDSCIDFVIFNSFMFYQPDLNFGGYYKGIVTVFVAFGFSTPHLDRSGGVPKLE